MKLDSTRITEKKKSFELGFDRLSQHMVVRILDMEGMYPLLIQDPEAGTYRILKTKNGNLQMVK